MKGGTDIILSIFTLFFTLLLITVIAPLLSGQQLTANLQISQTSSSNEFRAISTAAAIRSNRDLMNRINNKTVLNYDADLEDDIESVLSGQSDSYKFSLSRKKGDKWEDQVSFEQMNGQRRFTRIYIASPSENTSRMTVAVGEKN